MYVLLYFFTIFLMTLFPVAYRPGMAVRWNHQKREAERNNDNVRFASFLREYITPVASTEPSIVVVFGAASEFSAVNMDQRHPLFTACWRQ